MNRRAAICIAIGVFVIYILLYQVALPFFLSPVSDWTRFATQSGEHHAQSVQSGRTPRQALTSLKEDEIIHIAERSLGGDSVDTISKLGQARVAMQELASKTHIVIDGPRYVSKGGKHALHRHELFLYRVSPDAAASISESIGEAIPSEVRSDVSQIAPFDLVDSTLPLPPQVRIRFEGLYDPWFGESHLVVQVLGLVHDGSEFRELYVGKELDVFRQLNFGVFRPITIRHQPRDAAERIVAQVKDVRSLAQTLGNDGSSLVDAASFQSSEAEEQFVRAVAAVLECIVAGRGDVVAAGQRLDDELIYRAFNGVNWTGVINVLIVMLFCVLLGVIISRWCLACDVRRPFERAFVELLPLIGFMGTLIGMMFAFGGSGTSEGDGSLLSYIAISIDTTVLAIISSIVLLGLIEVRSICGGGGVIRGCDPAEQSPMPTQISSSVVDTTGEQVSVV